MTDWKIFQGSHQSSEEKLKQLLSIEAPSWRQFIDADQLAGWDEADDEKDWQTLRELAAKKKRDIRRGEKFRLRITTSASDDNPKAQQATPNNPYA